MRKFSQSSNRFKKYRELYAEIPNDTKKNIRKIINLKVRNTCFNNSTYLLRSKEDLELLVQFVKDMDYINHGYDTRINRFYSLCYKDICFPCFAVMKGCDFTFYSVDDVQKLHDNAASMLELVKKGAK